MLSFCQISSLCENLIFFILVIVCRGLHANSLSGLLGLMDATGRGRGGGPLETACSSCLSDLVDVLQVWGQMAAKRRFQGKTCEWERSPRTGHPKLSNFYILLFALFAVSF